MSAIYPPYLSSVNKQNNIRIIYYSICINNVAFKQADSLLSICSAAICSASIGPPTVELIKILSNLTIFVSFKERRLTRV